MDHGVSIGGGLCLDEVGCRGLLSERRADRVQATDTVTMKHSAAQTISTEGMNQLGILRKLDRNS
jgi:hypothetical protein